LQAKRLLIRGEWNNPSTNIRKALIVLNDLKKGKLKGRGETTNEKHVWSVQKVKYENKYYVFASGDSSKLNIFRLKDFDKEEITSKTYLLALKTFWKV
jgi:hypothetical protein